MGAKESFEEEEVEYNLDQGSLTMPGKVRVSPANHVFRGLQRSVALI